MLIQVTLQYQVTMECQSSASISQAGYIVYLYDFDNLSVL